MSTQWDKMNKALDQLRQAADDFSEAINNAFEAISSVIDFEQCRVGEAEERIDALERAVKELGPKVA